MRKAFFVALGAAALIASAHAGRALAAPSPSPSASPAPNVSATPAPQFDRVDVVTLMAVVIEELKQYQGSIELQTKPSPAMPTWDPLVFYAGVGADRHQPFRPIVWTIADTKTKGYEHALLRAYVMAVMDTGEAGPKFKRAYDVAAGEDQSLPGNVPDPYLNRHAVAEPFVTELTQAKPPK
jgi:hypothetical protein